MTDRLITTLFHDFFSSLGMSSISPKSHEYEMIIDERYPVLLRYDREKEQMILLGELAIKKLPPTEYQKHLETLLDAALNPLRETGPGVGIDYITGTCFSYFTLPRSSVTPESMRTKLAELIEWNKQFPYFS